MKRNAGKMLAAAIFAGMVALAAPQKSDSIQALFRAAMDKETVDGDLKAAIEQYKTVIAHPGAGRDIVAKALVRLGLCYEKQGSGEARKAYERVEREFTDQPEAVQHARGRLAAEGPPKPELLHRRVWTGPDAPPNAVDVSFDDRYLTFVREGNLAVRDLSTGEIRQITRVPPKTIGSPKLSPDSKRVAYWVSEGDGIAIGVMNMDGSGMRSIARFRSAAPIGWSPDMKKLLVQGCSNGGCLLSWVNIADGGVQPIPTRSTNYGYSTLSPDGAYIAFAVTPAGGDHRDTPKDLYVIGSDGTGETALQTETASELPAGWSPDSKQILFTTGTNADTKALWALPFGNGKAQGAAHVLLPALGRQSMPIGITRSGTFYYRLTPAFSDAVSRPEIWVIENLVHSDR